MRDRLGNQSSQYHGTRYQPKNVAKSDIFTFEFEFYMMRNFCEDKREEMAVILLYICQLSKKYMRKNI